MVKKLYKFSDAKIEGEHRFQLTRIWDNSLPKCLWIMLNPSTADAQFDDPTIRKITHFSDSHLYGGFHVVNLISYITPNPRDLVKWLQFTNYDIQTNVWYRKNFSYIKDLIPAAGRPNVIFAWGARGSHPLVFPTVQKITSIWGQHAKMFGLTEGNQPKHPLYLPNESRLEPFPYNKKLW